MATKIETFNQTPASKTDVEKWDTRFGKSPRVVKRNADGTFVSNVSARQMIKA
jgi:hypothetical protein